MSRGFSLLEVLIVLALSTLLLSAGLALRRLSDVARLDTAKRAAVALFQLSRRQAYLSGAIVELRAQAGGCCWTIARDLLVTRSSRLPDGVRLSRAPSSSRVRFFPSGTAENGTFQLALGNLRRDIIVNQRGAIR